MRDPKRDEASLRPVGVVLAAVVAGLGAGKAHAAPEAPRAPHEPSAREKTFVIDHTNHPGFEEDPDMIVGPSAPVAPFGG